jgi:Domain of unknown function (DUF932)
MKILTLDELERNVPAAFAESPADHVSDRYSFISTKNVIERLADTGWFPVRANQSRRVRDTVHATHQIVFRKSTSDREIHVGGTVPEMNLFNNHAALKRARLLAGFYRLICSNGLVASVPGMVDVRVSYIHIDNAAFDFNKSFNEAIDLLDAATTHIEKWMQIQLNFVEQNEFAAKAVLLRNHNDPVWSKHFDAHEFLNRRRDADRANDLWTVFNVVQENIMKGGVQGAVRNTKPITQVAEIQRINEGLWQLTTEYGQLHGVN